MGNEIHKTVLTETTLDTVAVGLIAIGAGVFTTDLITGIAAVLLGAGILAVKKYLRVNGK